MSRPSSAILPLLPGMLLGAVLMLLSSCLNTEKKMAMKSFPYERFRDSLLRKDTSKPVDTANVFDSKAFTPGVDSLQPFLEKMDSQWQREAHLMEHFDSLRKKLKKEAGFSEEERKAIRENILEVDSFLSRHGPQPPSACTGKDCLLFIQIDKSRQILYLYLLGELKDSFRVSTGKGEEYDTPAMELHPEGPVLTKYTSRKFPGGNYSGLGNMPYAVFLKNGYAIHGTTPGNYSKLGTRASHGCIRLHPDNAKVFNALVKTIGLRQTWISVKDSLP